ncbi:ABC transporter ATP-binding protein [Falsarthrobacter nasiphocae]|uniref:ATP-binding cassette subfamily C protein n=1 Tax=Falsarthrobacter nasiphocae TaxID=189863 RepID=A0AAE3YIG0_9MICC|nr:ABC transporter ATP-binding protein [Falsarthrobacter nasiphocae]MDR6892528.1 ATP-binding cassette subfamily C protein [Falsarthrobacter nasiphocae]
MSSHPTQVQLGPDGLPLATPREVLRHLAILSGPHRRGAIASAVLSLAAGVLFLVFPSVVGEVTALAQGRAPHVPTLVGLGIAAFVLKPVVSAAQQRAASSFGLAIYAGLSEYAVKRVMGLHPRAVECLGPEKFTARSVRDCRRVGDLVANGLPSILLLAAQALFSLVFLAALGPWFLAPMTAALALTAAGLAWMLPRSRAAAEREATADAQALGRLGTLATGGRRLEQAGWLDLAREDTVLALDRKAEAQARVRAVQTRFAVVEGLATGALVVGPMILAALLPQGAGALGADDVARAVALGVALRAVIGEAVFWVDEVQLTQLAFRRIFGLEHVEARGPEPMKVRASGPAIACDGVPFAYPGAREETLRGVSLTLRPGEHAALVGLSGSGKSTLLRILAGQLEPTSGEVTLAGVPAAHAMDAETQGRDLMLYACQEPFSFAGTVGENVLLTPGGGSLRDKEQVRALIREAGLHLLVGLDLDADCTSDDLSAGQLRDLGLLRLLWRPPLVILFDETFAGKTLEEQRRILAAIPPGTASLSVVHDHTILPAFDMVFRLDDGVVAAEPIRPAGV